MRELRQEMDKLDEEMQALETSTRPSNAPSGADQGMTRIPLTLIGRNYSASTICLLFPTKNLLVVEELSRAVRYIPVHCPCASCCDAGQLQ